MFDAFLTLFMLQALLGAFDTLYHHELKVALHQQITARLELLIHAMRALLYGVLFVGLAWFEWHGYWVWVLCVIVAIEVGLTLWDFTVEDQTRLLPKSERIIHTVLAINGGALFALLAFSLPHWFAQDTELVSVSYGWRSWFLFATGIGVTLSGLRDAFSAWKLQQLSLNLKLDLGPGHKRLLITGGTGFIGTALCTELLRAGHDLTLISRNPLAAAIRFNARIRAFSNCRELSEQEHFDAVINLAGAPVVGPLWSKKRKTILLNSRLNSTEDLLGFVRRADKKPSVWIQASAIGYYGTQADHPLNENAPAGHGFAAELCQSWEQLTNELDKLTVRRVILRFGLVFGRSGGSLPMMLLSFRLGIGSIIGDGKQHIAWVHIEDLLNIIALSIADETINGEINVVAPDCPTYREFALTVGRLLARPVWLQIPAKTLRKLLGEMASLFVDGPVIVPTRLQEKNFRYHFPDIDSALMDLT